jgi:hypothetical protein
MCVWGTPRVCRVSEMAVDVPLASDKRMEADGDVHLVREGEDISRGFYVAQVAVSHGLFRDRNSSPPLQLHSAYMGNCCLRLHLKRSPLVGRQHLNRKLYSSFLTLRTRETTLANEGASKNNLHA